jgi:hypothetical protein
MLPNDDKRGADFSMGRPSVSEAPSGPLGRSEGDAVPPSRAAARLWPSRLRLLSASPEELRFVGSWPAGAPLVLTPVLLVLGCLGWVAPGPMDARRALASALLLGSALALIAANRPRRVELRLRPRARQLHTVRGCETLPEAPHWLLVAEQPLASPHPTYAALLVDGERRWRLLDSDDPAQLLRQLQRVLACWPGRVEQAWGLPNGAEPWQFEPAPPAAPAAPAAQRRVLGAGAGAGLRWAMLVTTGLVLIDLAFLLVTSSAHVPSVHVLSLILPAIGATSLVVITLAVLTRHPRLLLGEDWVQESCVLGSSRLRERIPSESVRGVYVLAGSKQRHLLIDGSAGPLALLVRERDVEHLRAELASQIGHAPAPEPSESIASAPRRWQSG